MTVVGTAQAPPTHSVGIAQRPPEQGSLMFVVPTGAIGLAAARDDANDELRGRTAVRTVVATGT